ncbi:MAG TPA: protein kinase, partial [Chloroflexia bacterium]|nr:protein kinase [Chloroflexia bacterium]
MKLKSYHLREQIGEGTLGLVYRATQPGIGRDVAIKLIRPAYANHPDFVRRFAAEAQIVARLEHPHIVPLYDYWRDPSGAFLVMRYIRGGSLLDALARGPLSLAATLQTLQQIGGALGLAHQQGVIHRDIKPANILRDEAGHSYLADFGIATVVGRAEAPLTGALAHLGSSPAYQAPEQIRGDPAGPQTDIYSLGVLLFEMLGGAPPFQGSTPAELRDQQLYAPLPPLSGTRPELPIELMAVLERATAKDPAARYGEVRELVAAFRRAAGASILPEDELRRLPTGRVFFLFTDIEGSMQRWERYPTQMQGALDRHDGILRQAIAAHEGRVFQTAGDSFLSVFVTARGALDAALAAQRGLEG